jgi:hypothetical protein
VTTFSSSSLRELVKKSCGLCFQRHTLQCARQPPQETCLQDNASSPRRWKPRRQDPFSMKGLPGAKLSPAKLFNLTEPYGPYTLLFKLSHTSIICYGLPLIVRERRNVRFTQLPRFTMARIGDHGWVVLVDIEPTSLFSSARNHLVNSARLKIWCPQVFERRSEYLSFPI